LGAVTGLRCSLTNSLCEPINCRHNAYINDSCKALFARHGKAPPACNRS
jgi:hypothetical protein